VIYASTKAWTNSFFIEKKWLMEFYFDENKNLKNIKIRAGLTGP
jgi:hypothetical protein